MKELTIYKLLNGISITDNCYFASTLILYIVPIWKQDRLKWSSFSSKNGIVYNWCVLNDLEKY